MIRCGFEVADFACIVGFIRFWIKVCNCRRFWVVETCVGDKNIDFVAICPRSRRPQRHARAAPYGRNYVSTSLHQYIYAEATLERESGAHRGSKVCNCRRF